MRKINRILKLSVAAMLLGILMVMAGCHEDHHEMSFRARGNYPAHVGKQRPRQTQWGPPHRTEKPHSKHDAARNPQRRHR